MQTNCNKSFLSNISCDFYELSEREFKDDSFICPISSLQPSDEGGYLKWINIPISKGLFRFYLVEDLSSYFQRFSAEQKIPDTIDPSFFLNHMKKRVDRQSKLDNSTKNLKIGEINNLRSEILKLFLEGSNSKDKTIINTAFIVNLKTLMEVVPFFSSIDEFTSKKKFGFCFRKSSASKTGGNGECTVFSMTVSYLSKNQTMYNNNRFLDLHGVGIYDITLFSTAHLKYTSDMKTFLEYVNYREPDYSCLIDMLTDPKHPLLDEGSLDFNLLVRNE